ncbi:ABC transporter ATP-binding protein [Salinicola aestuarinus]|uniref:ABC transporter ATP-binding protein n=1 Tax=Salinicola aestuarinus TaxID=1949082 RepID=UPI000DA24713|nr:dipeptide ABC transporter ATP-binding protein [Salinicola aestuarinus]
MSDVPVFELHDFSIRFADYRAVETLDLKVHRGETVAIVGESGSGKSVSVLGAMGLLPPGAEVGGERRFEGRDLNSLSKRAWNALRGGRIGFVFQEPMTSLNPLHTVGRQLQETLRLHQGLRGREAKRRSRELLDRVRLPRVNDMLGARPDQLSGGQRQRVMIAIAIANAPALLIADEPTTALDVTVQREILGLLDTLRREEGMGLLLISHDLNLVKSHADRVVVMKSGSVIETARTSALFTAPRTAYSRELIAAVPDGHPPPVVDEAPILLEIDRLGVQFPRPKPLLRRRPLDFVALEPLSISLRQGETLGVVGESGSGKSTLAFALLRLVRAHGRITFDGERLDRLNGRAFRQRRRQFQIVFQDPFGSLSPRMSVADIVSEGLRFHQPGLSNAQIDAHVGEALAEVGLPAHCGDRYPHEFSGGQRQRIAIARAVILKPRLLVLDEPTSALDRTVQKQLVQLLRELQARHRISYLFISHDLAVVRAMSHRLIVLKDGAVVETGTSETVFDAPRSAYTRCLIEAAGI